MKFFDDINIEKLNSLLKFKTKDNNFKIKGSIELYTMKNTIKEKKTVVKRINDFLDEKYKESFISNELMKQQDETGESVEKRTVTGGNYENNEFNKDFYEQKRRLSVTSDYYVSNNGNAANTSSTNSEDANETTIRNGSGAGARRPSSTRSLPPNKKRRSSSSSYSVKLNDEKLNKIINDTEYFMKMRQQNMQNGSKRRRSSSITNSNEGVETADKFEEEQNDFKDFDFQMGPFGNISDPQARKLFSQIIMILNSSFQDHDFVKIISPLDFKELPMETWQAEFNNIINTEVTGVKASNRTTALNDTSDQISSPNFEKSNEKGKRSVDDAFVPPTTEKLSGLNSSDLWKILNNKIDLDSCFKILEYSPTTQDNIEEQDEYNELISKNLKKKKLSDCDAGKAGAEPEEEIKHEHPQINKKDFLKDELEKDEGTYVWSKLWFLINKKMKRVAFIYIICSRSAADQSHLSDEDHYYYDAEDAVIVTSDEGESEYGKKGTELVNSDYNEDYDEDDDLEYAVESDDESE